MSVANPYEPHFTADGPVAFVGREDVFAFFRQHLVGAPLTHGLVLIGRAGLGKSALLHQLERQIDEAYRPCIVRLSTLDLSGEDRLLAALVEAIHATLEGAGASTYRLPDWPAPAEDGTPPDLRGWFKAEYLAVAMSALRLRHLLLIFDDAHLLFDAIDQGRLPGDLFSYFADLLAAYERLALVFALDTTHEGRVLGTELFSDPSLHIRLGELSRADAERLVREPVAGALDYEDEVVEGILSLAGGHPFLLHSICRLLFRRSEERHHAGPITAHDLTAVHTAALDQADEIFSLLWRDLTPNERYTLIALVRLDEETPGEAFSFDTVRGWLLGAGYALNKTQLAAALRGLGYNGLAVAQADTYALPARLIAEWVRATIGQSVAEEPSRPRPRLRQAAPLGGLALVLIVVIALGAAALGGLFGGEDAEDVPATGAPTATLALNLEATRQADFATQTEQARPTATPTITYTPSLTLTPTETVTPSPTLTLTPSATPSATDTPRAMRTPRPTRTPITLAPTLTPTRLPTNTPRPSVAPTLHPGG
ncbi:MAG: P-loop NTPase fold protein [Anaerolineae bacterium]|nr:P-loop NTPase fold protein [Anaerolineae bacterium]